MADDEEMTIEPEEEFEEAADDADVDPAELDEDALDEDALESGDDDFVTIDDDFVAADDDDEDDDDDDTSGPVRRSVASEDEDDDDDIIAPDEVEADLDTILKDRLVAADDEDENEDDEPEEKGEAADRLQPKRSDEQLCPSCFLLVRQSAPVCPVGDDDCPIFS